MLKVLHSNRLQSLVELNFDKSVISRVCSNEMDGVNTE